MKIIDAILKALARTVALRWQAGLATVSYDLPIEVARPVASPSRHP